MSVLEGADFVINCIGAGGVEATETDLAIPARYGLMQTVGDTLGIGGIFRAMRPVPELLSICDDMKKLCLDALLLNYSNPMAMHCLALSIQFFPEMESGNPKGTVTCSQMLEVIFPLQ